MSNLIARRDNALGLAELAREAAERYRAQGAPKMAAHHDIKARKWQETADDLTKQIEFEADHSF